MTLEYVYFSNLVQKASQQTSVFATMEFTRSLRSGKNAECDLPPRCIVLFALEQRICNCVHICSFIFYMPLLVRYHNLSITVYKEFPEIDGDTLKWFSCN